MTLEDLRSAFTNWHGSNLAFWAVTALVVASAGLAALSRQIVHAAFGLFFTLLGIAGYYVLLGSGFLAVTQVVIYVGGILVLLMFGILLTNRPLQTEQAESKAAYAALMALGVSLLALLVFFIVSTPWEIVSTGTAPPSDVRPLGRLLVGQYLLPFELAGMTLLLCLVGAAYLVRRRER
ncbi:MAG: NAD(P)H-quinone oxidoreductase subunit 6 [Candidatus Hydrogenedentes bacterium]|nr:NAD(P)H-quinone oxidoreductase subunit 6 [Candidatus Hydrogenedentota bacterium]